MSSTHLSLNYHLVFATKNHVLCLDRTWRGRLHGFLGGCIRTEGGVALAVGGVADHIHILAGLKATHCLADVLRNIKSASSRWVHEEIGLKPFAWQEGYGAFTVSMSQIPAVRAYIENQEEHHRTKSFREEYLGFLDRHGIDPKFV
jgi:REP element-mobilizing transposase RayT